MPIIEIFNETRNWCRRTDIVLKISIPRTDPPARPGPTIIPTIPSCPRKGPAAEPGQTRHPKPLNQCLVYQYEVAGPSGPKEDPQLSPREALQLTVHSSAIYSSICGQKRLK